MKLKGKVCMITGAGKGIGRAVAEKFAVDGAIVLVCDIDPATTEEVVSVIASRGGVVAGFNMDVTKKESISEVVSDTVKRYGRIDVLINNAGIIRDAQLHKMSDEQFEQVIDINLRGTYLCTRAVVDIMLSQQSGVILNASSIVGIYGNFGQTNYAASKFGVIGMTKTWARELGRKGIRTNVICPGFINTKILESMPEKVIRAMEGKVPMGRLGEPEEVANVYAFLASDEASYINGAVIEVSGGAVI